MLGQDTCQGPHTHVVRVPVGSWPGPPALCHVTCPFACFWAMLSVPGTARVGMSPQALSHLQEAGTHVCVGGCIAQTCHHRALILEFHIGKNGVGHPELKTICAGSELPALCSRLGASGRPVWLGLLHACWLNCMFDTKSFPFSPSMAAEASRDVHGKVMLSIGFTPRWSRVSLGQGAGSGRANGGPRGCGPSVVSGSPQNVAMGAPACHAHVS